MPTPTVAEDLLDAAEIVLLPRSSVVELQDVTNEFAAFLVLAVAFHRAPASVKLRAIYERWDQRRIVRELY